MNPLLETNRAFLTQAQRDAGVSIPIGSLGQNTQPIVPPVAPTPIIPQTTNTGANMTALTGNVRTPSGALVNSVTGELVEPPPEKDSTTQTNDFLNTLKSYLPTPTNLTDLYNKTFKSADVTEKETAFNQKVASVKTAKNELDVLNAELQGITDQAKADVLALEGQGRGIDQSILSRQAQETTRQAAIKALPTQSRILLAQAKVAAAQGDAELAQSIYKQAQNHVDKIFQIQAQDAENQFTYQTNLVNKVLEFADKQETKALNTKKEVLGTNQTALTDARNYAQQLSASIFKDNPTLASQIASITPPDINSKTFQADLDKYNQQVAKLQAKYVPKVDKTASTLEERTAQAVNKFSRALVAGAKMGDIEIIGSDGYINPSAWKAAIKDAPAEGLSREQFIKQFGYLLNPNQPQGQYGLTPVEMKLIKGEL